MLQSHVLCDFASGLSIMVEKYFIVREGLSYLLFC